MFPGLVEAEGSAGSFSGAAAPVPWVQRHSTLPPLRVDPVPSLSLCTPGSFSLSSKDPPSPPA